MSWVDERRTGASEDGSVLFLIWADLHTSAYWAPEEVFKAWKEGSEKEGVHVSLMSGLDTRGIPITTRYPRYPWGYDERVEWIVPRPMEKNYCKTVLAQQSLL